MAEPARVITSEANLSKKSYRILNTIEQIGNKLPHPFFLFVYLAAGVILLSWVVGSIFDQTVVHPGTKEELPIKSLISAEGIQYMLTSMLGNFTGFKPLGYVLGMVMAIGLAEKVGLMENFVKKVIASTPKTLVTYVVVTLGIVGNVASDAANIFIPPLAALVFYSMGRHPIAGIIASYASLGAGFGANIFVANIDALLSGISTEVARTIDPNVTVTPIDNWFFSSVSTVVLIIVGVWVTEKIIEPKLGTFKGKVENTLQDITHAESRGLRNAGIAMIIYIAVLLITLFVPGSPLRDTEGGFQPLLSGIIPIIMLLFLTAGITYGITVKKIKRTHDIPKYMGEAMKEMSGYIVLIFAVAQFIAYFNWTNLGTLIAVKSVEVLEALNFTGLGAIVAFILLNVILNLFMYSGSAQWALAGPIFIPMFMILDYNPAFIQAAYRIADSTSNILTPLNPYIIIILTFMKNYDKKAGLGTLISLALPYSLCFLAIWIVLFLVFALFNIPVGPGIGMHL